MAAAAIPIAQLVGSVLGPILGGWAGRRRDQWNEGALINLWNRANQGDEMAREMWAMFAGPLRDAVLPTAQALGGNLTGWGMGLQDTGFEQLMGMTDLFRNAGGLYMTPEMEAFAQGQAGLAGQMGPVSDVAAQGFLGGGWTPQYQAGFDQIGPYMAGWGNNAQMALGDVGPNLLGMRGQNAFTQALQDRSMDVINVGGMNPNLDYAMAAARGILGTGGFTPGMEFGSGVAGTELLNRGADAFTDLLQSRGLDLATRESLLSPQEAVTFAREGASQSIQDRMEQVYRQALARGGGPGAIVAAGTQNQMMADFADQAARAESEAARNALLQQQQLQLQQAGMGREMIGTGGGLETQRFGQAGDLLSAMEAAASGRMGQAFGAIPGTQTAATSFMQALLQGGLGAGQLEAERMGLGTNMAQALLQNQLGFGNMYTNMMGNQNQYALGLGGLYNQMMGQQGNLLGNAFQNYLGSGQLGVQRASNLANAMNQQYGNLTGQLGTTANIWNMALNPLGQMAQGGLNYAGQYVDLMGQPFRNTGTTNAWGGLANLGQQTGDR